MPQYALIEVELRVPLTSGAHSSWKRTAMMLLLEAFVLEEWKVDINGKLPESGRV